MGLDNDTEQTKFPLPISPLTRLCMAFSEDLKRDTTGLLTSLKDKYVERATVAEQKWQKVFRGAFYVDAVIAFLITGHDFKIPVLDIRAIEIPAVVEAATITSAFAVVILAAQFVTWASYDMILRQYGNAAAGAKYSAGEQDGRHAVDPDFVAAADIHTELVVKLLRSKFNITGPDYYEPGKGFRVYSGVVGILIGLLFVLFPLVHWLITGLSLYATYTAHGLGFLTGLYSLIVIVMNLLAVMIGVGTYKSFHFDMDFNKRPWTP